MTAPGLPRGEPAAGPAVRLRQARDSDRAALAQMFARCTPQTIYQRFHGHVTAFPKRYLAEALSGSQVHYALVACADPGRIVALASCRTGPPGAAEAGILVEDAWQRRGIGGALLREIARYACRAGLHTLTAQVLSDQSWIVRLLSAYGPCESVISHGVLEVSVTMDACTRVW